MINIPGGIFFDFGLMLIGGGAIGFVYLNKAQSQKAISQRQNNVSAGTTHTLTGAWRLASVNQESPSLLHETLMNLLNQTWTFHNSGKLVITTFGFRKELVYTFNGGNIHATSSRDANARFWSVIEQNGLKLVIKDTARPSIVFHFERKGE